MLLESKNPHKFYRYKIKPTFFFLCELPLIFGVTRKRQEQAEDICNGTPDIKFEQDWSVGLDDTLLERQKIKNYFSSFKDFSGENRLCHIVGL